METAEFSRRDSDPNPIEESSESFFRSRRRCCGCCFFPSFDRLRSTANDGTGGTSLWSRGVGALMKIREWSELVAGPRWKTFIRRFNRSGRKHQHVNLQYDPLSYAMNFDEGPEQTGHFDEEGEDEYFYGSRNFSSRYARGSIVDQEKDGPNSV